MALKFDDYFDENQQDRQQDQDMIELDRKAEEKRVKEEAKRKEEDDGLEDSFIVPNSHRRKKLFVRITLIAVLVIGLYIFIRLVFFTPLVEEGQARGYVLKLEKVGGMFDSYEGLLVLDDMDANSADSVAVGKFRFSVTEDTLGRKLMESMEKDSSVVLTYRRYDKSMPWRGESKVQAYDVKYVKLLTKKQK